jgi:hypothetical protein
MNTEKFSGTAATRQLENIDGSEVLKRNFKRNVLSKCELDLTGSGSNIRSL